MNNKEIGVDESKKCKALMETLQGKKLNEVLLVRIEVAGQKFEIKEKKSGDRQCKSCDKNIQV